MTRGSSRRLSLWESVSRTADTLPDEACSGSDSGLLPDMSPLPAPVLAALEAAYELGRELGRGVSGVVFLARDRTLDRPVALKVLRDAASENQRARFAREGRIAASLHHPGIVGVLGSGNAAGAPYLAYELVPGARSLGDVIPTLDRRQRISLVRDLARAAGAAHAAGFIHRDIKPANVLVAPDGAVRLTDFGLGADPSGETLTQTGYMVGTPVFMAPELIRGKHSAVCAASDVWALGVLLYACCADALPFDGNDLLTLSTRICSAEYVPLVELDPRIDPKLVGLIARALQIYPAARFPSGSSLADALDAWLSAPSHAEPAATPTGKQARRTPLWLAGGLAGACAVVLFSWALLSGNGTPATPRPSDSLDADTEAEAPAVPSGARLVLPVGWTADVEADMHSEVEFSGPNHLRTIEVSSWFRMDWVVLDHRGNSARIEATIRQLRFSWDLASSRGPNTAIRPVRFDSQRTREADHPLLRTVGQSFTLTLNLVTGRVERVRGIEAIYDHVFAGLSRGELVELKVPWLQSSKLVQVTLDNLLAVFPAAGDSATWNVSRQRTRLARGSSLDGRGLPSVELGQVVGSCERDVGEREPTLRLEWATQGRASGPPTPWERGDGEEFEVSVDCKLRQEGEYLAEQGIPHAARYRETWTQERGFSGGRAEHTTKQSVSTEASLRIRPE